jgi:TATA-box binding protein (TBP) (component of TFIID and TFIIIB)
MESIDIEWENFLSSSLNNNDNYNVSDNIEDNIKYNKIDNMEEDIEDDIEDDVEYKNIDSKNNKNSLIKDVLKVKNKVKDLFSNKNEKNEENKDIGLEKKIPIASDIYISTKTKIAYLNTSIDLKKLFWDIPIIQYNEAKDGIIKKQMKFNIKNEEELNYIKEKLLNERYYDEYIITHINNPNGRIKFKDVRKISIGISKKDILSYRLKKKSAFYNCFAVILRLKIDDKFKEFHVKIFNTGKLEIPGVKDDNIFDKILKNIINILQKLINISLEYEYNKNENVLINSNFNCGFYLNREVLYNLLKFKYNIQAIYDPCSYPGIQCKFYYNPDSITQNGCNISNLEKKNLKEVSFMIFRTGSVLIVGKCDEKILIIIYNFLKNILINEYDNINQNYNIDNRNNEIIYKTRKMRKRNIIIERENI